MLQEIAVRVLDRLPSFPWVVILVGLLKRDEWSDHYRTLALDLCAEPCNNYAVPLDEFGGVVPLAEVRLQEGESLENALRRFKRKVQQEDIIKEVKRHSFYLKPGEKKRVKEALARKRSRKKARKEQD
jgi:small subunit ribosomal protein S21